MLQTIFLLAFLTVGLGLKLPSYIEPCSKRDPKIEECIKNQANNVIPIIAPKGDKTYRIPSADPLIINQLEFSPGQVRVQAKDVKFDDLAVKRPPSSITLNIVAKDLVVRGLKNSRVVNLKFNYNDPNQHYDIEMEIPRTEVKGKYKANGKILLLPITGDGDCYINITNAHAFFSFDNKLTKRKDGLHYATPVNPQLRINVKGDMKTHLTNLFSGNKLLADNMNQFLNDNWQDVFREIGPTIADAIEQVIMHLLTNMFDQVPFEHAFAD